MTAYTVISQSQQGRIQTTTFDTLSAQRAFAVTLLGLGCVTVQEAVEELPDTDTDDNSKGEVMP